MSIKLTIDKITVELTQGDRTVTASMPSDLLGALLAGLFVAAEKAPDAPDADAPTGDDPVNPEGNGTTGAEPGALPALTPEAPQTSPPNLYDGILAFLVSDERYSMRSRDSVIEAMSKLGYGNYVAARMLETMEYPGTIVKRTRRSDGATMFQVA